VLAAFGGLLAADADARLANSHHDFAVTGRDAAARCQPCHPPEPSSDVAGALPLWNHGLRLAAFALYQEHTLNPLRAQPTGSSKLCLSCHDGTFGVDTFAGGEGRRFARRTRAAWLSPAHHPVSVRYDSELAAMHDLFDPAFADSGLGGTIESDLLQDGRVECSTCHDVHQLSDGTTCEGCPELRHAGVPEQAAYLRQGNLLSALCLTCHDK
jgi:hypothetical protein